MCSFVLLHTLSIMFRLHALQLKPTPVDDLVGEDGDQDGLEHWTTAVFVEVALNYCQNRSRQSILWHLSTYVRVALRCLGLGRIRGLICGLHTVLGERRAAHGRREESCSAQHCIVRRYIPFVGS